MKRCLLAIAYCLCAMVAQAAVTITPGGTNVNFSTNNYYIVANTVSNLTVLTNLNVGNALVVTGQTTLSGRTRFGSNSTIGQVFTATNNFGYGTWQDASTNGGGGGSGTATNMMFPKASNLVFPYSGPVSYVICDATNNLIAGFVHVYDTNNENPSRQFDIIFHVDAITSETNAPSICQFQGAVGAGQVVELTASFDDATGHFKMVLSLATGVSTVHVDAGQGVPELNLTGGSTSDLPIATTFQAISLEISANSFKAKSFAIFGGDLGIVSFAWPTENRMGYNLGDPSIDLYGNILTVEKVNSTGGIDPPYVLYDAHTRAETKARVLIEVPQAKQNGAALFWNPQTARLEVFVASVDKFYDINGTVLTGPTAQDTTTAAAVLKKQSADRKTIALIKAMRQRKRLTTTP